MMDEQTIMYIAMSSLIAVAVVANGMHMVGILSIVTIILGFVTIGVILIIAFADYLIFPAFTRLLGLAIIPHKDYVIPKAQDAVVKYTNGIYYATGYLAANIYNYVFAQEQVQEESESMRAAPEKWERAIMNVHFPFRFSMVAAAEEIQKYREELEAKRGMLEFNYNRESQATNPSPMGLETIQRQINVIQARIDRIGEGERPVRLLCSCR